MTDWMSTREAAQEMGITVRTLYRLIDEGKVRAYQIGRVIKLRNEDITGYLESVRIEPGQLRHLYEQTGLDNGEVLSSEM